MLRQATLRVARPVSRIALRTAPVTARTVATHAKPSVNTSRMGVAAGLAIGTIGFGVYNVVAAEPDYEQIRKEILEVFEEDDNRGPFLIRLAWHASGTYDKNSKTGGSCGATMRFAPECAHGANAGLLKAQALLDPIKKKHPEISYADLWTLAAVVVIEAMGGPAIGWKAGRTDKPDGSHCTPDGRLPDADGRDDGTPAGCAKHLRDIFHRQGFNDQEIVVLAGAHALGRCHTDRSGFDGPWTRAPTTFSNEYYRLLIEDTWTIREWDGPQQWENSQSGSDLMMLPTDMALIWDKKFRAHVEKYAKDEEAFFRDFAKAFQKLEENGVKFAGQKSGKPWYQFW